MVVPGGKEANEECNGDDGVVSKLLLFEESQRLTVTMVDLRSKLKPRY